MKTIVLIFLLVFGSIAASAQVITESERKELKAELKELKHQMENADPEERKMMEQMGLLDMIKTLEKQLGQVEKALEGVDVTALDPTKIPDKPSGLPIPPTPVGKEQLKAYLQPFMRNAEAAIKPAHKAEITKYLNKGTATGQTAIIAYLMNDELDKALYLLLNACITNPEDYASLNNLGALMTMSGYAHKSLPILQYVQQQVHENTTLRSNIGQAWLSLGYVDKAEKILKDALEEDEENGEAALSLAVMYGQQGNAQQCGSYARQAVEKGGNLSPEAIDMVLQYAPDTDLAELIRPHFKKYYKDHDIFKTFRIPEFPSNYEAWLGQRVDIDQLFADLDASAAKASGIAAAAGNDIVSQSKKLSQARITDAGRLQSLEDLKAYKKAYFHPLFAQAGMMLHYIDAINVPNSYTNRIQKAKEHLQNQWDQLNEQLNTFGMDCGSNQARTRLLNSEGSRIHNEYAGEMEYLLRQQLQERLFWGVIREYPNDPTYYAHLMYSTYLTGLHSIGRFEPGQIPKCDVSNKPTELLYVNGKLRQWELDHCNLDFGGDAMVVGFKMDCTGFKTYADLGAGKFEYGESIDPVTWETTGRSITVEAGKSKKFEPTKNIKVKAGASVSTTFTFDGTGNMTNIIVKGGVSAGAEGPMGGSAGVSLGNAEVSLRGGFNAGGPSANSPGSSFLRN